MQNAHVRASSILRKAGAWAGEPSFEYVLTLQEVELVDLLSRFPGAVDQSATEYKPLHIANSAYELARAFHGFYHSVPVLQAEDGMRRLARLHLTAAVRPALADSPPPLVLRRPLPRPPPSRQTLANSLRLLVIRAPDVM